MSTEGQMTDRLADAISAMQQDVEAEAMVGVLSRDADALAGTVLDLALQCEAEGYITDERFLDTVAMVRDVLNRGDQ